MLIAIIAFMDKQVTIYLGWLIAIFLGLPAAFYYGKRLWKEWGAERDKNVLRFRDILRIIVEVKVNAELYRSHEFIGYAQAWFNMRPWIAPKLRNQLQSLQRQGNEFTFLLQISNDLVTAKIAQAAYYEGTYSKLSQRMDNTGGGFFKDLLQRHLFDAILSGAAITEPWLRDNYPEFYQQLQGVASDQLKRVIEIIRQAVDHPCLQRMRQERVKFIEICRKVEAVLIPSAGEG